MGVGDAGSSNTSGTKMPVNPIRFMQLALGTTVFFTMMYMWQFISLSVVSPGSLFDAATSNSLRSYGGGDSQILLQGFEAGYKFVSEYDVEKQGPLYILFMSDADENGTYWCPDSQKAKKPVYDVFARAPRGSRLLEIRVGSADYWNDDGNEFKQNELFYIDFLPSLIRYEGAGNSSTMLNEQYTLDYDLLEYFFRVPYPAAGEPNKNKLIAMNNAPEVQDFILNFDDSYPLFVYFVSGHHTFNGRLWCPYCDRADVAIMHYYNYSAPESATLLRVTVSHSYKKWKKKSNPFKLMEFRQNIVSLRGVPFLGRVRKDPTTNKVVINEFKPDFMEKQAIVEFFAAKKTS